MDLCIIKTIELLIISFIFYYVSLFLHELGHLICGYLSGYQFISFRLMNYLWTKDESGKIKLTKSPRLNGVAGECLMEPPDNENDFRFVACTLGGCLANFITGCAVLISLCRIFDNDIIPLPLHGAYIVPLLLGVLNFIPMSTPFPRDREDLFEALKSADAKHGLYVALKINAEMSKGKRFQDFDKCTFAVGENADVSNYFVANMILMRSSQLEEIGTYDQSYQELLRLEPSKLPHYYSSQLILSIMFHELVYFRDEPSVCRARERIEAKNKDKRFQKFMKSEHPKFLPFYAAKKAFLDSDAGKACELIAQARKLNRCQQNPGMEYSVALKLDKLEAYIK